MLRYSLGRITHAGLVWLSVLAFGPVVHAFDAPLPLDLKDGDRVVLIGDTFIERDQQYGYLETAITLSQPNKNITFRNLGWSGDTVRGLSRAGFDPPEAGFRELTKQLTAARPSVVIVGYGMADSFDGKEGLPRFINGLDALLDLISGMKARVVLLSPIAHEDLGRPLPDPASHNRELRLYRDAIRELANRRGAWFVDLDQFFEKQMSERRKERAMPFTDNGIHLTEDGYASAAYVITQALGLKQFYEPCEAEVGWDGKVARTSHTKVSEIKREGDHLRFVVTQEYLSSPVLSWGDPAGLALRAVDFLGVPPGRYELKIDGKNDWRPEVRGPHATRLSILNGSGSEQTRQLRRTINEKNRLFFHRWRPENITYLFGFRSHEQGNNAIEVPRFDPLVEDKEREVARLRKPVPHAYELIRVGEVAK